MEDFQNKISFRMNENVFLKDPLSSDLGKKIIRASIDLIAELGFDDFTFKKLATKISSTEASVYRYFENKHNLFYHMLFLRLAPVAPNIFVNAASGVVGIPFKIFFLASFVGQLPFTWLYV